MIDDRLKSGSASPRLRCPACSSSVELPAEQCPDCGVNLRTAYIKADRRGLSRLTSELRAGVMMLAIVALAGVATVWEPAVDREPPPAEDRPPPPLRVIDGAPQNFWRLAAEHPVLLRPYIIVYEARASVMRANERFERRQRLLEELEGLMSDLEIRGDEDLYSIFVKVPPSLREPMLRELDNIYGQHDRP